MIDIYWNIIQELQERLNFYEEKYACHITKVLPNGNIAYEFNPSCTNFYRTVKKEKEIVNVRNFVVQRRLPRIDEKYKR